MWICKDQCAAEPSNSVDNDAAVPLMQNSASGKVDVRQCLPYCLQPSHEPGMLCRPQHVGAAVYMHLVLHLNDAGFVHTLSSSIVSLIASITVCL